MLHDFIKIYQEIGEFSRFGREASPGTAWPFRSAIHNQPSYVYCTAKHSAVGSSRMAAKTGNAPVSLRPMSLRPGGGSKNPFERFAKGAGAFTEKAKVLLCLRQPGTTGDALRVKGSLGITARSQGCLHDATSLQKVFGFQ